MDNIADYLRGIVVVSLITAPIYIMLDIYSFKYYAAKFNVSEENVSRFLQRLSPPLRFILSKNLKNIHYNNPDYPPEAWAKNFRTQRIVTSILPVLFIVTNIIGATQLLLNGNPLLLVYIIHLCYLCVSLFFAWRFGHKFKDS